MINIPKLDQKLYALDYLLKPIMFLLSGFKTDSIQKTHGWHLIDINQEKLDANLYLQIKGDDTSKALKSKNIFKHFGHFHMPIFGGFRNYVVIESKEHPWYIGWLIEQCAQLSKLPIKGTSVKVLSGKKGTTTYFFGFNKEGKQIKLEHIASGKIGDYKFKDIPLY